MKMTDMKLVTLIADDALESKIVKELMSLDVPGYTLTPSKGRGAHRSRESEWEGETIRVEVVADADLADAIVERIAARYLSDFGVTLFVSDVAVVRSEKFLPRMDA